MTTIINGDINLTKNKEESRVWCETGRSLQLNSAVFSKYENDYILDFSLTGLGVSDRSLCNLYMTAKELRKFADIAEKAVKKHKDEDDERFHQERLSDECTARANREIKEARENPDYSECFKCGAESVVLSGVSYWYEKEYFEDENCSGYKDVMYGESCDNCTECGHEEHY
jgi:hypothetical protein